MTDGGFYGLTSKEEVSEVFARLQIAAWMNLIPTPDLEAVDERRRRKNAEAEKALSEGGIVYGPVYYTPSMYLQYELTQFKLDYTVFKGEQVGRYPYREITEEEKRAFYDENRDLFTRKNGDKLDHKEKSMNNEKEPTEEENENIHPELLRECPKGK